MCGSSIHRTYLKHSGKFKIKWDCSLKAALSGMDLTGIKIPSSPGGVTGMSSHNLILFLCELVGIQGGETHHNEALKCKTLCACMQV